MSRQFHRSLSTPDVPVKLRRMWLASRRLAISMISELLAVDVVLQVSGIGNGDRSWERHWKASIRFMLPETPIQCNGFSAMFVVSE